METPAYDAYVILEIGVPGGSFTDEFEGRFQHIVDDTAQVVQDLGLVGIGGNLTGVLHLAWGPETVYNTNTGPQLVVSQTKDGSKRWAGLRGTIVIAVNVLVGAMAALLLVGAVLFSTRVVLPMNSSGGQ